MSGTSIDFFEAETRGESRESRDRGGGDPQAIFWRSRAKLVELAGDCELNRKGGGINVSFSNFPPSRLGPRAITRVADPGDPA